MAFDTYPFEAEAEASYVAGFPVRLLVSYRPLALIFIERCFKPIHYDSVYVLTL